MGLSKGQRVKITSLEGPHGRTFESLRKEFENERVGTVQMGPDEADYYAVQFPGVEDRLNVHASQLTSVR